MKRYAKGVLDAFLKRILQYDAAIEKLRNAEDQKKALREVCDDWVDYGQRCFLCDAAGMVTAAKGGQTYEPGLSFFNCSHCVLEHKSRTCNEIYSKSMPELVKQIGNNRFHHGDRGIDKLIKVFVNRRRFLLDRGAMNSVFIVEG